MRVVLVGARCLGDALMTLPALARLKQGLLSADLEFWAPSEISARVLALSGLFTRKEIRVLPSGNLRLLREFLRLRRNSPTAIILFSGGFVWALGARLSRARIRVGLDSDGRAFLLTHAQPSQSAETHQVEVCQGIASLALSALELPPRPEVDYLLPGASDSLRDARRLLVIPSASRADKCWPAENFVRVIQSLLDEDLVKEVLVLGSPAEREYCESLATTVERREVRAFNAELEELVPICLSAGFALGNSTGLTHLAAFYGCLVLSLSNDPAGDRGRSACLGCRSLWSPGRPPRGKKIGDQEIPAAITPDLVLAQLRDMIAEGSPLL